MAHAYLLYLEPFVYFSYTGRDVAVFNEINNTLFVCRDIEDSIFRNLLDRLQQQPYTCSVQLQETEFCNESIQNFIAQLKKNYAGDCVADNGYNILSVKPSLVFENMEYVNIDQTYAVGNRLKLLPQEVTINFGEYQTPDEYPTLFRFSQVPTPRMLTSFLDKVIDNINTYPNVKTIHIIAYPDSPFDTIKIFCDHVELQCRIHIHLDSTAFSRAYSVLGTDVDYYIYTQAQHYNHCSFLRFRDAGYSILPVFRVKDFGDIHFIERLNLDMSEYGLYMVPGDSAFLTKNVYTCESDILEQHLTIKRILINREINTSFFGRIFIDIDGTLAATSLRPGDHNIRSHSLHDFIFEEMKQNGMWFLTRDKVSPCKECMYCHLCPPISETELKIGKYDLCNLSH